MVNEDANPSGETSAAEGGEAELEKRAKEIEQEGVD